MATARRSASSARQSGGGPSKSPVGPTFAVFADNGGLFHWEIVAADGKSLARSGDFVSEKQASMAAREVCAGAGSATLEPSATGARGA